MMPDLSPEQRDIVELPLKLMSVVACAGSGKTMTAVHRLARMRRLYNGPGVVALLSFSNVAVDTFRREYSALMRDAPAIGRGFAVEIDTMDGFITTNVLRPHGHRLMQCDRTPYLVDGHESFLNSFKVYDGTRSHKVGDVVIAYDNGQFRYEAGRASQVIPAKFGAAGIAKLGKTGAYTHAAGRYWVIRTLQEQRFVLRAFARRYPHILIDEAQDIGPEHQAILELLIGAGSEVSLIGDPNQGIYEFAHADGRFLRDYGSRAGVAPHSLTVNFRSVPSILKVANILTGRRDTAKREEPTDRHAAFYMPFKATERTKALASFQSLMRAAGIEPAKGVVLCRSADWAADWSGEGGGQGVGVVRCFANAAISRDQHKNYRQAFAHAAVGLVGLLAPRHCALATQLERTSDPVMRGLRRALWCFVRDAGAGLPSAFLAADTDWHPQLSARIRPFLDQIARDFGLSLADNLGNRLARKKLQNRPLVEVPDLASTDVLQCRVSTVHKVKGESLEAVLYVAKKGHVRALLDGTASEEGRIGYVALTRARNLFVLAVPDASLAEFAPDLEAKGLRRAGFADQARDRETNLVRRVPEEGDAVVGSQG